MKIKEEMEEMWNRVVDINQDAYGKRTIRYCLRWANMMEDEIKAGNKLTKDIISKTSQQADDEGVTGFMTSWAFSALKQFWYYGDMLDGAESIYDF
jgi:hypothetical protein